MQCLAGNHQTLKTQEPSAHSWNGKRILRLLECLIKAGFKGQQIKCHIGVRHQEEIKAITYIIASGLQYLDLLLFKG